MERVRAVLRKDLLPVGQGAADAFYRAKDEYAHLCADGINVDLTREQGYMDRSLAAASELRILREVCSLVGLTEPETKLLMVATVMRSLGLNSGPQTNGQVLSHLLQLLSRVPKPK